MMILVLELGFESGPEPIGNMQIDIALFDNNDRWVSHCRSRFVRGPISLPANTAFVVSYALRSPRLAPGHYQLAVYATNGPGGAVLD